MRVPTSNVTKDDFLVHGLEEVQPAYAEFDGDMYAGRLPADNGDRVGDTMFWMFEPHTQEVPDTLVIWLNGGPGCSSFNCGVMMEHSPVTQPLRPAGFCCLQPTPDLQVNEHAWTKATTMLYVEHPWGTGFSYGKPEPATELEASGDMYAFIQNFFKVFPHLASRKLYIFGESYAGMFVPSILRFFHRANLKGDQPIINVAGGAIVSNLNKKPVHTVDCLLYRFSRSLTLLEHYATTITGQWMDGSCHSGTSDY